MRVVASTGQAAARRRLREIATGALDGIGASDAPNCVVVAKGDDDLPPHNALRSCHATPEVNGCAVPLHGGPTGPSAPVTAGDPAVARSGVVAHGAHGILKE